VKKATKMLDRLDLDRPNLVKEKMLFLLAEEDEGNKKSGRNTNQSIYATADNRVLNPYENKAFERISSVFGKREMPHQNSSSAEKISLEAKMQKFNSIKRISTSMPVLFNANTRSHANVLKALQNRRDANSPTGQKLPPDALSI